MSSSIKGLQQVGYAISRTQGSLEREAAALEYVAMGWALLPLAPRTKSPCDELLPKGRKGKGKWKPLAQRPATEAEVRAWFAKVPDINIGVIMGPSGLAVLDVDNEQRVAEYHLNVPPSVVSDTGRGHHYWYMADNNAPYFEFDGGELRTGVHYCVAPPSVHPSGATYRWVDLCSPFVTEPVELPALLTEQVAALPKAKTSTPAKPRSSPKRLLPRGTEYQYERGVVDPRIGTEEEKPWRRYVLQNWFRDADAALAVMRVCGADVAAIGESFRCVLPGHTEQNPSASLFRMYDGYIMYRDWHYQKRHGREWYTLAEVYASVRSGEIQHLRDGEKNLWLLRALAEAGVITPPRVIAPKLPADASQIAYEVHKAFMQVLSLRSFYDASQTSTPFSWHFAAMWTGRGRRQTGAAIKWLTERGYLVPVLKRHMRCTHFALGYPAKGGEAHD